MRLSALSRASLFLLLFAVVPCSALADTYTFQIVGNGNYDHPFAVDAFGDWTVDITGTAGQRGPYGLCGGARMGNGEHCYQTFINGEGLAESKVPGELRLTPAPIPGIGCLPGSGPEELLSCVNGRPIYLVQNYGVGGFNSKGLYYGVTPDTLLANSGSFVTGTLREADNGNVLFVDGGQDRILLGLDVDTLATTPEPRTWLLLATGFLPAGLLRRVRGKQRA